MARVALTNEAGDLIGNPAAWVTDQISGHSHVLVRNASGDWWGVDSGANTSLNVDGSLVWTIAPDGRLSRGTVPYARLDGVPLLGAQSAPGWAGARQPTYRQDLALYNGESPRHADLLNVVQRGLRREATVHLVCAGDSKTAGSGVQAEASTTDVSSYPARLASLLGARPGVVYAWSDSAVTDSRWAFTGMTHTGASHSMQSTAGTAGTATFTSSPATGVAVFVSAPTTGDVTVTVDGVAQTVAVTAADTWQRHEVTGLTNQPHTVSVTRPDNAQFRVLAVQHLYATPGLTISNAGYGGSAASQWRAGRTGWTTYWKEAYALPGVTVDGTLSNHGTNLPTDTAGLSGWYDDLIAYGKPVLAIAPGGLTTGGDLDTARTAVWDNATRLDLPLVDFRAVVGTQDQAATRGLMNDQLHENSRGYMLEAIALSRALTVGAAPATTVVKETGQQNLKALAPTLTGGDVWCRRIDNTVELVLSGMQVSASGAFDLMTLPVWARPTVTQYGFSTKYWSNDSSEEFRINPNGVIQFRTVTAGTGINATVRYFTDQPMP